MSASLTRRIDAPTGVLAGLVFFAALFFFDEVAADLPVLREMRGIIFYGGWIQNFSIWNEIAQPVGGIAAGSRMTAMMFAALDAHVCGFATRCINISQAILLSAAACMLFVHLAQLLANRSVAAILALLWCISLPALEGALWQATQLDKLAMFFSLLYLIILFHHARSSKVASITRILSCNLSLSISLILAFKAKEISFFLVPATVVVVLLEGLSDGLEGILTQVRFVIMPVAYGSYYIQHYLRNIPPDMQAHVGSGNPVVVLPALLVAMLGDGDVLAIGNFGEDYRRLATAAVAAMMLLILLAAGRYIFARRGRAAQLDQSARTVAYLAAVFAFNMLIVARTSNPHPYYLMISEGALLGLIGVALTSPAANFRPLIDRRLRLSLLGLLGVSMLLGYVAQRTPGSATFRIQRMARTVNDGFATIRSAVPPGAFTDASFIFPSPIDGDWYFFGSVNGDQRPDPELMSFIYGRRLPVYVSYSYTPLDDNAPNPAGMLRVAWNVDGSVRDIELGSVRVFKAARP